jgi:uncharacterized protein YijF (DUF1287 family)
MGTQVPAAVSMNLDTHAAQEFSDGRADDDGSAEPGAGARLRGEAGGCGEEAVGGDDQLRSELHEDCVPERRCGADVVVRAGRDGLGLDLQRLVHEDMARDFGDYPRAWSARGPDANIDHRRVLNLEAYWRRVGACVWSTRARTAGDGFPVPVEVGDLFTWLLDDRLPHIGVVVATSRMGSSVVHNIGAGVQQNWLVDFAVHEAKGHYRWPVG